MSHDWDEIRGHLQRIAGGEETWGIEKGARRAAHETLQDCWDAINHDGGCPPETEFPHIGERPDWRRMPRKAEALLAIMDAVGLGSAQEPSGESDDESPGGVASAVLTRLQDGGGVTMAMLREATGVSEKEIRTAIKVIRQQHQSDSPDHPVSYSGKWWLAKELSAMGKDLQPTARGTLKVEPSGDKPLKPPTYQGKSKKELISDVAELLRDHPDAEKVVLEVVTRIDRHFTTKAVYKDVCAEARKAKERAEANLKEAVESGRETNDTDAALVKLDGIEQAWQAKEEVVAKGVEDRKEARTNKKQAELDLERLMSNLRQLDLPGVA